MVLGGALGNHSAGAAIEQPAPRFVRLVPRGGKRLIVVEVASGARTEGLDQPDRVPNARQPRHRLRIVERFLRLRLAGEVKHCSGLTGAGLTNS
jgi:hypothetical protein